MTNRLIHGDCLEVPLPLNYFDTLITDPPYGLGFMGKDWDAGVPGKAFWKKFLDTCKPGAFAFVFGGTRTFHRLTCAIEDAGWEIRDCMMWLYGSGFPKSLDIGKAIDKLQGNKREIVGKELIDTGIQSGSMHSGRSSNIIERDKTRGTSEWEGYGTALKPAWEPIIVAMKPLDGTFAHNAEKWGTAGLWIGGGRIIYRSEKDKKYNTEALTRFDSTSGKSGAFMTSKYIKPNVEQTSLGRWPANVILDEEVGAILDGQTGRTSITGKRSQQSQATSVKNTQWLPDNHNSKEYSNDSGGASRFFYQAKASTSERNKGCDNLFWLEGKQITEQLWLKLKAENEENKDNSQFKKHLIGQGNIHNTVKPLALVEYLCKLSRPPQGGIVLDPFAGSGTTALACMNTDRQYIIIEKEREYCEIIAARLGGTLIEPSSIPQRPRLI